MLEFLGDIDTVFWVKFIILFIILAIVMFMFAPTLKWKLLLTLAAAIGIYSALKGKSMKGISPYARRGY